MDTQAVKQVVQPTTDQLTNLTNQIFTRLDAISQSVGDTAHKYGPDVIQVGLQVTRVDCVANIIHFVILLLLAVFLAKYCIRQVAVIDWDSETAPEASKALLCVGSGITSIICLTGTICNIPSTWDFVGIIYPKLYIAHAVVEKALSH